MNISAFFKKHFGGDTIVDAWANRCGIVFKEYGYGKKAQCFFLTKASEALGRRDMFAASICLRCAGMCDE